MCSTGQFRRCGALSNPARPSVPAMRLAPFKIFLFELLIGQGLTMQRNASPSANCPIRSYVFLCANAWRALDIAKFSTRVNQAEFSELHSSIEAFTEKLGSLTPLECE